MGQAPHSVGMTRGMSTGMELDQKQRHKEDTNAGRGASGPQQRPWVLQVIEGGGRGYMHK